MDAASAKREGLKPSAVSEAVTATYFVGENPYRDKLVVSLVADPEDLFGENGIYVTGKVRHRSRFPLTAQGGQAQIRNTSPRALSLPPARPL